jgi:hypothetical protein
VPLLLLTALLAARPAPFTRVTAPVTPRTATAPALSISSSGDTWLAWAEPGSPGGRVRAAHRTASAWSAPVTVAASDALVMNGVDGPRVFAAGANVVVSWGVEAGAGEASTLQIAISTDHGATWRPAVRPHRDATATPHGFVSLGWDGAGAVVVWLDGRAAVDSSGHARPEGAYDTSLRATHIHPADGEGDLVGGDAVLDPRACDCCPTAAVGVAGGATLVAYRDRSPDERRDMSIVRIDSAGAGAPAPIHADGWHIEGCPVNGPALAASGNVVTAAWFTGAGDTARVLVARSRDGGTSFLPPSQVDGGRPLGRVAAAPLPDGGAVVTWLEHGRSGVELRARRMHPEGTFDPALTVRRFAGARGLGVPRVATLGWRALFVWSEPGTGLHIVERRLQ